MSNKKFSKRALISSIVSLFICVAMLVGTTYAWFTDSAVSANNKITSGNLDVELYKWTSATDKVAISQDKAPVFDADILWEPGYTSVAYLSIKNEGSLALKYRVALDVTSVSEKNLADVMSYVVKPDAKYGDVTAWAGNGIRIENAPGMNETDYVDITLAPGDEHFFALSIHMDEEAGNEYMNQTITFDIRVLAGQAVYEEDSFNNQFDVNAEYSEKIVTATKVEAGATAAEAEIRNADNTKVASVLVPADALAEGVKEFVVSIEESDYVANIQVDTDEETKAFDVTVSGLKENNTELITVSLRLPTGLDPETVKVYHYDELIASNYNPNSGYVTFQTTEFSPFTVVYDAESEYEAPEVSGKELPTAIVEYAAEYVGEGKIEWGNYGQWSPTAGLDSDLEAAFVFTCPTDLDPEVEAAFENWYCDFYVSLNRDLGENQIFLGGNYGSFGWIGFHNGDLTLNANEEIGLLEGVTTNPWTYAEIRDYVGTFICGVGDVDDALNGATFTVKLRLTNPKDAAEYYDVNVVTHTFGAGSVIDGENVVLSNDIDLNNPDQNGWLQDLFN